jgi:hypothetical protein
MDANAVFDKIAGHVDQFASIALQHDLAAKLQIRNKEELFLCIGAVLAAITLFFRIFLSCTGGKSAPVAQKGEPPATVDESVDEEEDYTEKVKKSTTPKKTPKTPEGMKARDARLAVIRAEAQEKEKVRLAELAEQRKLKAEAKGTTGKRRKG